MSPVQTIRALARLARSRLVERPWWRWRYRHGLPPLDPELGRRMLADGDHPDWLARLERSVAAAFVPGGVPRGPASEAADAALLSAADRACAGIVEVLGSGPVSLGDPIDWHLDFTSGHRWADDWFWRLDHRDLGRPSDVKVPWELARFHEGLWLGIAYQQTGEARFAAAFAARLDSWLDANPPGRGIHWLCPMELAIRACNWIHAFTFLARAPEVGERRWARMLASLVWHGRVIRGNLEIGRHVGNHYVADLVGLYHLGALFRDSAEGRGWLRFAERGLERETQWQVLPDGVHFEQAVSYHRLVAELLLLVVPVGERLGRPRSAAYLDRLARMVEFTGAYVHPDGTAPLVGDGDDGRVLPFTPGLAPADHRHLLALGAGVLRRPDLQPPPSRGDADARWLAAALAAEAPVAPTPGGALAFPAGGFFVLRGNGCHTFLDAGPLGSEGRLGHGHLDTLSLELSAPGGIFLCDTGCLAYTSDARSYREQVSTAAHNTVGVDGLDQAELTGLWRIAADGTRPRVVAWEPGPGVQCWEAEHHGYGRLRDPVVHRRRVTFWPDARRWEVLDVLEGREEHELVLRWHCAPGVVARPTSGHEVMLAREGGALRLGSEPPLALAEGWVAPSYGVRRPAVVLVAAVRVRLPFQFRTVIEWMSIQG
ncbi:MAG: alginate lyase family protein [Gemmatimonadetes bacterium]|nr:alginate lyase family protein [Gemmatimonadota bacterium]